MATEQGEYRISVGGLATKIANCTSACDERIRMTSTTNPVQDVSLLVPQPAVTPSNTTSFNDAPHLLASSQQILQSIDRIDISSDVIHNL